MDIATNARIKTDSADPGLSPADARQISLIRATADVLLTPEQEQVKKDTGFVMDHLQALRHLQQRAELCRKAQK